ncbi:hypothetical protein ACFX1T_023862 [Malus domestica]
MNPALSLLGGAQQRRYQLCKRCDHGAVLQFKGMFCMGIAGADQLPSKMIYFCGVGRYNGLLNLMCRLSCGDDLIM